MSSSKLTRLIKLITSGATLLLLALVGTVVFQLAKLNSLERSSELLDAKIEELENKKLSLQDGISSRSADSFIEDYAREYLGMLQDGEVVFIIK